MSRAPSARSSGSVALPDLAFALSLAAVGALGLLHGSRGEADPLAALTWIVLIAPAGGFAAGARALRMWPLAPVVPALWILVVGIADATSQRDLPALGYAALAIGGWFALGYGLGRWFERASWRGVASVFLLTVLACALPLAGLVLRSPFQSRVAARVLDASPLTITAECAGVDWMRHPPIYDGSATVDIDPTLRGPFSAALAASLVFVVGCGFAVSLDFAARRRRSHAIAQESVDGQAQVLLHVPSGTHLGTDHQSHAR